MIFRRVESDDDREALLEVTLEAAEMRFLRKVPKKLKDIFLHPDRSPAVIDRLFPPTYDDPETEKEHRRLLGETLLERRKEGLECFSQILDRADGGRLTASVAEINLLLQVLNDYRLMLGVEMNLTDNDWSSDARVFFRHPRKFAEMAFASALQEEIIRGCSEDT
ncbi:MAG TPA: DUF2017 family protein [Planctomycetes bacterium]|nr:DUF2017 family protein [Planctomycetota bacterium]